MNARQMGRFRAVSSKRLEIRRAGLSGAALKAAGQILRRYWWVEVFI
jgi:hypothetical protein